MPNTAIVTILSDFVSLFFPGQCMACENTLVKGEDLVCTSCRLEMPATRYHMERDNPLANRLAYRFPIKYGMACYKFSKSGRVQHLLHQLKYNDHPEIGVGLGRVYGDKLASVGYVKDFDVIIPVPLHPTRYRKRGYNQSAKFAEGLSEKLAIPFSDEVMSRKMKTETQTTKSKLHRWENMGNVFQVNDDTSVRGKSVLLVDDVITTGSTLEACAQVLLNAGIRELSVACIAEA